MRFIIVILTYLISGCSFDYASLQGNVTTPDADPTKTVTGTGSGPQITDTETDTRTGTADAGADARIVESDANTETGTSTTTTTTRTNTSTETRTSTSANTGTVTGTGTGSDMPRCIGLTSTCGASENENCCTNLLVPGGTFNRSNDPRYPATVSDFYLDKYEITVGRFRAFVNAGKGTQINPPAMNAGAHPLITGTGWDSAWNTHLAANTTELKAALNCSALYQTWTDTPNSNENRPQNCLNWIDVFAFCAWDSGRLPTAAEWNYAASGGNEQRKYPWSIPPTSSSIDDSYAIYCANSCASTQNVGMKPAGNGRWGHADLAGNARELVFDISSTYYSYPTTCDNCAYINPSWPFLETNRETLGGAFNNNSSKLLTSAFRESAGPTGRSFLYGARCARDKTATNPI